MEIENLNKNKLKQEIFEDFVLLEKKLKQRPYFADPVLELVGEIKDKLRLLWS